MILAGSNMQIDWDDSLIYGSECFMFTYMGHPPLHDGNVKYKCRPGLTA